MTTLSELQAWLAEQLVKPRALSKYPAVVAQAEQYIVGTATLSPVDRVEIYREQFWLRHTASLLEDFPGVSGILGQADWERLAESYLTQYPCRSFNLRDLGQRFSEHIDQQDWLPHRELCHDMARLEWSYIEMFDAADVPPLDGDTLGALSDEAWQQARMVFHPALRLLQVRYPVGGLRKALRDKSNSAPVAIPAPEAQQLLLYRAADLTLQCKAMPLVGFRLLERLLRGESLATACEGVALADPSSATLLESQIGEWFAEWTRIGLIVEVTT